jgi:holo-[acyl-carrier protein] synthase
MLYTFVGSAQADLILRRLQTENCQGEAAVIKIGTDICSIARVTAAYDRFGERFLDRILTGQEKEYVLSHPQRSMQRLAARFAAKEAASKALGTGWCGVSWKEIEIIHMDSGEPSLRLHDRAVSVARSRGLAVWEVSISHEREYATATVLAYSGSL